MTVPDAWNTASPSVGPAGADRRTVAVEPVASAILAGKRALPDQRV